MLHNNNLGYDDFNNVDLNDVEDMKKALEYYENKSTKGYHNGMDSKWYFEKINLLKGKINEVEKDDDYIEFNWD